MRTPFDILGKGGGGGHHHGGGHHGWGGGGRGAWGTILIDETDVDDFDDEAEYNIVRPHAVFVIGMVDVGAWQQQMNTLKQVPVSVAKILLRNGQEAIARAISSAKQPFYKPDLPGNTERENVAGHLRWHADALAKLVDNNAMYGSGDDLKKLVLAAYVDTNAVEEGAAWIAPMWSQMWSEIGAAIAALPKALAQKVNETAGSLLGMPLWLLITMGIVGATGAAVVFAKAYGAAKGSR